MSSYVNNGYIDRLGYSWGSERLSDMMDWDGGNITEKVQSSIA